MDWIPTITEGSGSVYMRIVDALSADIASGRLARGQQLPTHRALARALDIDLTTVTRAYGEARRRGLIDARVDQGTFVSETTARVAADIHYQVKIDLSMNVPPHPVEANLEGRIAQGLALNDNVMLLAGALPAAGFALAVHALLGGARAHVQADRAHQAH